MMKTKEFALGDRATFTTKHGVVITGIIDGVLTPGSVPAWNHYVSEGYRADSRATRVRKELSYVVVTKPLTDKTKPAVYWPETTELRGVRGRRPGTKNKVKTPTAVVPKTATSTTTVSKISVTTPDGKTTTTTC